MVTHCLHILYISLNGFSFVVGSLNWACARLQVQSFSDKVYPLTWQKLYQNLLNFTVPTCPFDSSLFLRLNPNQPVAQLHCLKCHHLYPLSHNTGHSMLEMTMIGLPIKANGSIDVSSSVQAVQSLPKSDTFDAQKKFDPLVNKHITTLNASLTLTLHV